MSETAVSYQIRVERVGEGATQAVKDFQAVSSAAAAANGALGGTTKAMTDTANSSAAAHKSFGAFKGALTVVAGQAFPQLTASVMVAKNAVEALRAGNTQMTAGLALTTTAVVGLAGVILSAAAAWGQYSAERQAVASASALSEQETATQKRLVAEIDLLQKRNEITNDTARRLRSATGNSAGNRSVSDYLRYQNEGDPQEILGTIQRQRDAADSVRELGNFGKSPTAKSKAADEDRAYQRYTQDLQNITALQKEGLLTQQQADALADQMAIKQNNRLLQIKQQLTEMQQLGQGIAQGFAGGFSSAFGEFISGTKTAKEAFADFARSFISGVAQMIVQLLVLRALKSVFGASLGLAQGGAVMAANGVAGVASVSQATYFPKFNTIAGEAGREMLTVLARPRMMDVGGVQAVVGNAGPNQLAITNAADLARTGGGAGGTIVIQVQGTPDFEARVVQNSVKGAVVQVANDMRQDTPIARGVKGLTA